MKKEMKTKISILLISLLAVSCNAPDRILENRDLENGNWLLVNVNYPEGTLQVIDDEKILAKNKRGIYVKSCADCQWTTCDGFLKLYKDGELIEKQGYLSRERIHESKKIKNAYKQAIDTTIEPLNSIDFTTKWDSLKTIKNTYPTKYRVAYDNRDVIWVYQYE